MPLWHLPGCLLQFVKWWHCHVLHCILQFAAVIGTTCYAPCFLNIKLRVLVRLIQTITIENNVWQRWRWRSPGWKPLLVSLKQWSIFSRRNSLLLLLKSTPPPVQLMARVNQKYIFHRTPINLWSNIKWTLSIPFQAFVSKSMCGLVRVSIDWFGKTNLNKTR